MLLADRTSLSLVSRPDFAFRVTDTQHPSVREDHSTTPNPIRTLRRQFAVRGFRVW
jgi:hypothetical protein